MKNFRSQTGFTLVELMTVVGVCSVLAVIGIGALRGYSRHEDTRRASQNIANVLARARAEAVSGGRMTFVVFGEPIDGSVAFEDNQIAAVVTDQDDDRDIGPADAVTPIFAASGINPEISTYGAHGQTAMKTTKLPAMDESSLINPGDDLTKLTSGTSLAVDVTKGVPIVGFAPQGSPVTLAQPLNWGSGAGGVYLTDNDEMVVAIIVQPLGEVRMLTFDTGSGSWK